MVHLIRNFEYYYKYVTEDLSDPRTNDFFLASSHWMPIGVLIVYFLLVKKILPEFMKNREAFKMDRIVLFYNFTQIVFNVYLLIRVIPVTLNMTPVCAPVDYSNSENGWNQLELCYLYYILKVYDLIDTMFFILRKRQRQVTFLHIYHHTLMVIIPWVAFRYVAGGNSIYVGVVNTFVHIVMYFYYGISLWNSGKRNPVWWKKYLTQLQLVQFFLIGCMGLNLILHPTCNFPKMFVLVGFIQNVYLIYLFGTFYYKSYIAPHKTETHQKKN